MQRGRLKAGYQGSYLDVEGKRVHYLHAGAGRPIVLIHGLVGSSANWKRSIDALARHRSVYAIDLVNMGKSQRVENLDPCLEATADRVAAVMDALGIAEADLTGHSHGGAVALMLAARHPNRVRSLMLFAPANPFSSLTDFIVRMYCTPWGSWAATLVPYLPESIQRVGLERMYGDPSRIPADCLETYMEGLRVPGTIRHVMAIVRGWFVDMAQLEKALSRVAEVPTLLVWGDRDRAVTLDSGWQLKQRLRELEMVVVPGAGHVVFEEMPEEANRIMVDWLLRGSTATSPSIAPLRHQRKTPRAGRTTTVVAMRRLSPRT